MTKNTAPQSPTADDELPPTAVKERESIRILREQQNTLAGYAEDESDPPSPGQSQGDVWEKRYGDLRRHAQRKEQDFTKKIKDMEAQVTQLQQAVNRPMPKNKEELEAWKSQYPEIAAIIETLVDERAAIRTKQLESQLGGLSEELDETKKERAYAQLKALVPDIEELLKTPEWQAWFSGFPDSIQQQINSSDDPYEVAKMVNKFKTATTSQQPTKAKSKSEGVSVLDTAVRNTGSAGTNPRANSYKFTVNQIKAMSPQEYEKLEPQIDEARAQGLIMDDSQRKVYHTDYH